MTPRQRLIATLRGQPVDRPAVNFYEISSGRPDPDDPDPFNVYNSPDWRPLLELADRTDRIHMVAPVLRPTAGNRRNEFFRVEHEQRDGSRWTRTTLEVAGRTMTSLARRDPEVNTVWKVKHLLSDADDLRAYLQLPDDAFAVEPDVSRVIAEENALGEAGIVMIDTPDPLCVAAELFSMADYTVLALTERKLFRALLDQQARWLQPVVEQVAAAVPGRLWRICGPEYAAEPYLPPELFREYVVNYTGPMVRAIRRHGGYARIHCHGRLERILDHIAAMSPDGLDPIEPPPQGDVELIDVRRRCGREMVLFGNLEMSDIETLPPARFDVKVRRALDEGTAGRGRGFVLMPSAAPYGRRVSANVVANYELILRRALESS